MAQKTTVEQCDFVRGNPQVIPQVVADGYWGGAGHLTAARLSRADTSRVRQLWAEMEDREDEDLACVLADAYLTLHNIEKGTT